MSDALKRSLLTAGKYIFWTACGAAIAAAINTLPSIELPQWSILVVGAGLKSIATYIKSRLNEMN